MNSNVVGQIRVLAAGFGFLLVCLASVLLVAPFSVLYMLVPRTRPVLRYWWEVFWANGIRLVVEKVLSIKVTYEGMEVAVKERPLLIVGVHQSDLLHGVFGATALRLAGGALLVVIKQEIQWFVRWPASLLRMGLLIDRQDPNQSLTAIRKAVQSDPRSAVVIYPDGTRPRRKKVADQREKYALPWLQNTAMPRRGGLWAVLESYRRLGVRPSIYFISHRTEYPDWEFWELYRLIDTTVEVRVRNITEELLSCETEKSLGEYLYRLYEGENKWRGWS